MSRRKVLVKRLVCIEDLGNVDVLFTDKTGTLTAGPDRLHARGAGRRDVDPGGVAVGAAVHREHRRSDGQGVGGNPLDQALWDSPAAA
jgi:Mg2+-importing ATPase